MSDNPFLDTLRAAPAEDAASAPQANPFLEAMRAGDAQRQQQMNAVTTRAVQVAPDKYAEQKRVAKYLNYPTIAVESMPEQTARDAKLKEVQQNTADHPELQQRFTDEDFAKLAHDDTGLLSVLANSMKRGWAGLKETTPTLGFRGGAAGIANMDAIEQKLANNQPVLDSEDPMALRFMTPQQRAALREQFLAGAGTNATKIAGLEAEKRSFPQPEVAGRVGAAKTFGGAVDAFLTDPVKYIASIGPESLVQNAPGLVLGGPATKLGGLGLGAATAGAGSFVTDYNSTLIEALGKAGVDVTDAAALKKAAQDKKLMQSVAAQAFAHASIVSAFDAASAGAAGKIALPARTLAGKPLAREAASMAVQTPLQGALGGVGELGGEVAAGQDIDPGNILAEIVGEGFGAPAEVASMAGGHIRERMAQTRAEAAVKQLQAVFDTAAESKLRERDPESFAKLVQDLADNAPDAPKEVRFDSRQLYDALSQSGLDEAQLTELLPSVLPQLREALAVGGEVTVPIGEFTRVIGTDLDKTLMQHARIGDNELSQAEASTAAGQTAQMLKEQSQRIVDQAGEQAAAHVGAESVRAAVLDQLNTANRFTPDVNGAYAQLVSSFYGTMAGRLGTTPDELFARYPLRVQAEGTGPIEQDAYHGTPHTVDKFTTQKIGTGEGAQAFGWGMYFAGNKAVADFYRKTLTANLSDMRVTVNGKIRKGDPIRYAVEKLAEEKDTVTQADVVKYFEDALAKPMPGLSNEALEKALRREQQKALDEARNAKSFEVVLNKKKGNTYKVEIPEDADMLDYDASVKDQPPKVRAALEKLGIPLKTVMVMDPDSGLPHGEYETLDQARRAITRNNWKAEIETVDNVELGKDVYRKLSKKLGGDEAASKALLAAGVPGLRFLDADSRGTFASSETRNYVIFDDAHVGPPTLAQGARAPRGTFDPSNLTISLLQKADLSTFLHETGHFFLVAMADMASQPDAPAEVSNDMAAVLKWFGVKDLDTWNAMSLDQQRQMHEKFAESFEAYLLEGKAPSAELQPLFQRFRAWLVNVYRSLSNFLARAGSNADLNPEVRQVFDRMLASEDQIKQTEAQQAFAPLFKDAESAGMTAEQWAAYQAQGQQATADAVDKLQTRSIRDMRWLTGARNRALKALQKDAEVKRKAAEKDATAEISKEPVYQAQRWLRKGEMTTPEGEEIKAEKGFRLNTDALAEMYPDSMLDRPDLEKLKGMTAGNGLHPDLVAEMFGYSSGDQLVRAIVDAEPLASAIEGKTDQLLLERFGDLTTERGIQRAADEAVHNEARGRFVATELRALQEAQGKTERTARGGSVNVMVRAAKQFAADLVARRKVRELRPGQHTVAETRAAKAADAALRKGDTQAAIVSKRDQLLNHYAARETTDALTEVDKAIEYLQKFDKDTVRKKLPPEYLDQIDKLLERVDLRRSTTGTQIDKRASLNAWIKSQQDLGIDVELPAEVLEDAKLTSYKDMPLESFRGLVDSIKQIEHLGRLKSKLLTAKDQREFDAIKDSIVSSILTNAGDRTADTRTPTTNLGRALQGIRNFGAAHIKAATWARILDGGKDGGPVWEFFIRPANERGDQEVTMRAKATKDLTEIMAPLLKESKLGGRGVFFPSINRSLNRESVLAIALNTGNESNLQRLLGGEGWTAAQLKPVLDTLSAQDWQAVQKVWDYFESFRPQIAAKERRVFGKEPAWIEPGSEIATAYKVKGGYYPVKYDPAASVRAEEHADAEGARRQLQGAYGAATTKRSFTKARADEVVGRPLLYTLSGVYSGVNDVIHDLAWHEWLIDTNRLLKSQSIDSAIRTKYGPEAVRQLKTWRDAIAEGESGQQEAIDMALGKLRQSVSVAGLGFNVMSALMQPLGLTQSITRVGAQWVGKGLAQYVGAPIAKTREVNEKSTFMQNRARTRFRELNELRNKVQGQTALKRAIQENAYALMMRCQQMVDVPTWIGAYEKAIASGETEERAIDLADQGVIDSQGGGQTKDLSAIERGGPAQKLFTVFYSFMNTALNLGVASKMTPKSRAKFAVDMLMLYVVPAVLGSLLKAALTPGDSGDTDDPEKLVKKLAAEQISYLMGLVVVGREFAAVANLISGNPVDYKGPAGVRAIGDAVQFAKQAGQGEFDDSFRKAVINLMGDVFGLPSAQLNRTITGAQALAEGKTKNPAAVVLGYQEPR